MKYLKSAFFRRLAYVLVSLLFLLLGYIISSILTHFGIDKTSTEDAKTLYSSNCESERFTLIEESELCKIIQFNERLPVILKTVSSDTVEESEPSEEPEPVEEPTTSEESTTSEEPEPVEESTTSEESEPVEESTTSEESEPVEESTTSEESATSEESEPSEIPDYSVYFEIIILGLGVIFGCMLCFLLLHKM